MVLLLAADAVLIGDVVGQVPHRGLLAGAGQAVVLHGIEQRLRSEFPAGAGLHRQMRRQTHAFHSSGHDDFRVSRPDRLVGQHHRLQPRAANLVDGHCRHTGGNSRRQSRLASRGLAHTGLQHVAQDHLLHLVRCDICCC